MEYRVLGSLEVLDASGRRLPLGGVMQQGVLASLLLRAGQTVALERLVDELWDEPPATSARTVQAYVSRLRRELPDGAIESRPGGYAFALDGDELDLDAFERRAEEGHAALAGGECERAASLLREALALWRGPALAGLASDGLRRQADRLEELRLSVLEDRFEADLGSARHGEIVPELTTLVAEHPYRERLRAQLMRALYGSGRAGDALALYRETRRLLVEELGMEPGQELRELEKAILAQDSRLAAPGRVVRGSTNLPSPLTPLIGRERELAELTGLLSQARLVTLTGPGGSGKTRLALELAAELPEEFPDGVTWVPLQGLRDPALVLSAIADAVGAENGPAAHIGGKRMLLLLDNLEQLLPAAGQLADLLTQTTEMKLLATSREPLHLAGEHEYPVAPLRERDAVALFAERARAVRPDFEPDESVAEICRRLDCLPLAIELGAARVKALPSSGLLPLLERRLPMLTGGRRDAPSRQRTLRATIAWSYELLTPEEQRLFARLAVFAGGCTLEAAEQVCDADLDSLACLLDKSLLGHDTGRYSMLETIREYGLEQLRDSGECSEFAARHAAYFLASAERMEQRLEDEEEVAPGFEVRRLKESSRAEFDNSWAALTWAVEHDDREFALRLVGASYSLIAGRTLAEARKAIDLAFAIKGFSSPAVEAKALLAAGWVAGDAGDHETASAVSERSLALYRSIGDQRMVSMALRWRGFNLGEQGRRDEARRALRQAIALSRRYELAREHALGVSFLGELELAGGEFERASELLAEAVELHMAAGRLQLASFARADLADVRLEHGPLEEAARLYRESLAEFRSAANRYGTTVCLAGLAAAAATADDAETAGGLWAAFERYEEQRGALLKAKRRRYEHRLAALDPHALAHAIEHGRTMTLDQVVDYALSRKAQ